MQPASISVENYLALLEKTNEILDRTNQNLSLNSNPYGVLVGVLSFLLTFLAIITTYILWRQSKEYQGLFEKALENYKVALNSKLEQLDVLTNQQTDKIQGLINEFKEQKEALSDGTEATKEKIKELDSHILDLEKKKKDILSQTKLIANPVTISNGFKTMNVDGFSWVEPNTVTWLGMTNTPLHTLVSCTKCGHISDEVYCPQCGNKLQ